nr:erythromycin esterase family protein [Myxococcus sp. MH1]
MKPRSGWWCLVWLLFVGCAHAPRTGEPDTPKFEHVFQKPLEEALAVTRELLANRGMTFEQTEDPHQLLTTWEVRDSMRTANNTYTRYLVTGIAVGPRQSVVRVFKSTFQSSGNDASRGDHWWKILWERAEMDIQSPAQFQTGLQRAMPRRGGPIELRNALKGTRDLDLEKELTLRLESGPSLEVVSGNVKEDPRPPAPVRDSDFYLTRWKEDGVKEGPCAETMRGLHELLAPGLTLLVGEQLGSREAPAVVGELVCQVAELGLPVALGVSIPRKEQERLDRYLASPGAPADQDALLEGRFWHRPYQDGRSSRAILDLIDRVRAMRLAGLAVSLVAYDTDLKGGSERDQAQADLWNRRRQALKDEVQVVLAGNTHTRTVAGTPWDKAFTPMAHLLKASRLVVLEMSYAQGTRWGCDLDRAGKIQCGFVGATPSGRVAARPGLSPHITLFEAPTPEGTHGLLYVGELSPSLPAISPHKEAPPPTNIRPPRPMRDDKPPMF